MAKRHKQKQQDIRALVGYALLAAIAGMLVADKWADYYYSVPQQVMRTPSHTAVYIPSEGNQFAEALKTLTIRLEMHGYTIEYVEMPPNYFGLTDRSEKAITINQNLSVDGRFEVLVHEAGHLFHPPKMNQGARELFAEVVGLQVAEYYGNYAARAKSIAYLSQHKDAMIHYPALKADIDRATGYLTGEVSWPDA